MSVPDSIPLPRVLGLLRGLALSLGVVVGSGIFVFPAYVGQALPSPAHFLGIWVLGGLLSLCTAFCYAELATAFPRSGGYVVYLREVYGDRLAFVYGWAAMMILYPASVAGMSRVFASSLAALLGWSAGPFITAALAVAVVLLATVLNVAGVDLSSRLQIVFGAAKLGVLVLLAAAGVWSLGDGGLSFSGVAETATAWPQPGAVILGIVFMGWCFGGFLEIVVVAGEVRHPQRTLVRVLVGSVLLITAIYTAYAAALLRHLPIQQLTSSETAAADLARALWGSRGSTLVNLTVVVATGSGILSLLMSGPRILVGLAEAGLFFPVAARVHPRTRTPAVAVLVAGVASATYAAVARLDEIVKYFEFGAGFFSLLILGGGVYLRLRGRIGQENRRIPWWPLPVVLSFGASLGTVVWLMRNQPRASLFGLALMLVALPLSSRVIRSSSSRAGSPNPGPRQP